MRTVVSSKELANNGIGVEDSLSIGGSPSRSLFAFWAVVFGLHSCCYCLAQINPPSPTFSTSDILNAASGLPDSYSPYGLISIHGSNLSLQTVSIDFDNRTEVPVVIANGGTRVWIRNMPVGLLYVLPDQVVCLLPADLAIGAASIFVTVASLVSRASQILLR